MWTDISDVDQLRELASTGAVGGKYGRAVAVRVAVDQRDGVVKGVHFQTAQNRPENLLLVASHLRLKTTVIRDKSVFSLIPQLST